MSLCIETKCLIAKVRSRIFRSDFSAWQSAERDGNLDKIVERERKARRKKMSKIRTRTFAIRH